MTTETPTAPPVQFRMGMAYTFLVVACLFTLGSTLQLFLAGMSTFESGTYWSDHVFLGRIVSLFALALPILAVVARLSRTFITLSAIAAALYIVQVMLTYIDIGALAALHALNALPLIVIPGLVALRAYDLVKRHQGPTL